jgi:hypothetical protein
MAGSGRRFALEATFLVGLAVAVGVAGFSTGQIIGVMALGWLLMVLVELVSWRVAVRHPTGVAVPVAPASPVEQPVASEEARVEESPLGQQEPEPGPIAEEPLAAEPPAPKRRRGFWRRRAEPVEDEAEPEPPPRHVRLIPKPSADGEAESDATPPAESAEGA